MWPLTFASWGDLSLFHACTICLLGNQTLFLMFSFIFSLKSLFLSSSSLFVRFFPLASDFHRTWRRSMVTPHHQRAPSLWAGKALLWGTKGGAPTSEALFSAGQSPCGGTCQTPPGQHEPTPVSDLSGRARPWLLGLCLMVRPICRGEPHPPFSSI